LDRKDIKQLFRSIAQSHGFKCRTSRYSWVVGQWHAECWLYNSQWDSGMYIDVGIRPLENSHESLEDMKSMQYRVVDYDCPHHDMLRTLESQSETLSASDATMVADWTMSHIKSEWPSLEVIATKALDIALHQRIGALVSGGMQRWATAYLESLPKTS
jgi:hypothetical protein